MPHFRTWDDAIYYDAVSIGVGELLRGTSAVPAHQLVLNYEEIKVTY